MYIRLKTSSQISHDIMYYVHYIQLSKLNYFSIEYFVKIDIISMLYCH